MLTQRVAGLGETLGAFSVDCRWTLQDGGSAMGAGAAGATAAGAGAGVSARPTPSTLIHITGGLRDAWPNACVMCPGHVLVCMQRCVLLHCNGRHCPYAFWSGAAPIFSQCPGGVFPIGCDVVCHGTVALASDTKRQCFSVTFKKGTDVTEDYYTCVTCNSNWICQVGRKLPWLVFSTV